jgi:cyclopropane fatty-acyl-phospholipid synthase-like methyltransferase
MQINNGIRAILANPLVYELWMSVLGAKRKRNILCDEYIRPEKGMRIFDIGCGPAEILDHLDGVEYFGVDLSASYIEKARQKHGSRGEFAVQSADSIVATGKKFDFIMALGLLHHLEDDQCIALFEAAHSLLDKGGRFLTFDGVYTDTQSKAAKFFLSRDRGQNVRTEQGYAELARQVFGNDNVKCEVRSDMTRIPYTHLLMQSFK